MDSSDRGGGAMSAGEAALRPENARTSALPRRAMRFARQPATLALVATLALGLALRVVFFYGLVNVDPYAYADSAAAIARWQPVFDPDSVGSLYYTQYIRLSLTLPAGVLYRLFGPGEVTSTVIPIAASLALAVVAHELARDVSGRRAGIFAAFLVAVFPLNVINSTQFLPDTMLAFFTGLTMLLFLRGFEHDGSRWRRAALYFATGVAWALAFYARPTAVALAPPFAVLVLVRRRFHPEILAGVPGALVVVLAAQLLLVGLGGSLFEDVRTVLQEGRGSQPGALRYSDIDWSYLRYIMRDPMFVPSTIAAGVGGFLALAMLGPRRFANGRCLALSLLVLGTYLYFEFLMRLPGLYSWYKEPRYALPMLTPAFALAGIGLSAWIERFEGHDAIAAWAYSLAALAFVAVASVDTIRDDHEYWEQNSVGALPAEVAAFLDTQPHAPIFTWNDDFARYLTFYVGLNDASFYERGRNQGLVRNGFDGEGRSLVEPGSYVIVNEGQDAAGLPTAVPAHWQRLWERPGVLAIYRVPPIGRAAAAFPGGPSLEPPLAPGLRLSTAEVSPTAFPGQHVLVAVQFESALPGRFSLLVTAACGTEAPPALVRPQGRVFARELQAGWDSARFDMPIDAPADDVDCRIFFASQDVGPWIAGPVVRVPSVRVVEPETPFSYDPGLESAKGSGWVRSDQPSFSAGGVAVAVEPWAPLRPRIAPLPGGRYEARLAVYDYGSGAENVVELRLNGVTRELRWGGRESPPGVIEVTVDMGDVPPGGDLQLMPLARGQDGITIDRVVLVERR